MGEANFKPRHAVAERNLDCARELLVNIATAQRCAVALHEVGDDDLPGEIGNFCLIFPSGKMCVASSDFMLRAALAFYASRRFAPGKSRPKPWLSDIPLAERLVGEMRTLLSAGHTDVIGPPNAGLILANTNSGVGMSPDAPLKGAAASHASKAAARGK